MNVWGCIELIFVNYKSPVFGETRDLFTRTELLIAGHPLYTLSYSQLVYPLSQTALSQKPVSWEAVSQPVSYIKKD